MKNIVQKERISVGHKRTIYWLKCLLGRRNVTIELIGQTSIQVFTHMFHCLVLQGMFSMFIEFLAVVACSGATVLTILALSDEASLLDEGMQ